MAHERRSEVLRDTCALTLCDEPLAGGVEDGAMKLPVHGPEVGIALHDLVHAEVREQPARRSAERIQQLLQQPMQWHLPLSCLGLQQPHLVRPDADKAPQVPLGW